MSNGYQPYPSSHQQAFPPDPAQRRYDNPSYGSTPAGPSNYYYYRDHHDYYNPPQSGSSMKNVGWYDFSPPRQERNRKGYDYLASLSTSVSNLAINDRNVSSANGQMSTHPFQTRVRIHSDPSSPNCDKQLPPLPPPPPRPNLSSDRYPVYPSTYQPINAPWAPTPPSLPPRPVSLPLPDIGDHLDETVPANRVSDQRIEDRHSRVVTLEHGEQEKTKSGSKSFKPSVHPHSKPRLSEEDHLQPPTPRSPPRVRSDSRLPTSGKRYTQDKSVKSHQRKLKRSPRDSADREYNPIIDLTLCSSDDESADRGENVTPRSPARRTRAASEQPLPTATIPKLPSSISPESQTGPRTPMKSVSGAVQCSGFTRAGQPCKRLVKDLAPYLSVKDPNLEAGDESDRVLGRYCKDHAGMICQAEGFYWRADGKRAEVWINFAEFIPPDLGQQTQTLLRRTMESRLTPKETPGYLYAYELRDLETPTVVYFKVGRTDNVPRRIGEWTVQCQSKTPTLRDIFPLPPSRLDSRPNDSNNGLQRSGTLTTSYLPGATTHLIAPAKAMKRWERLVHIELADRCSSMSDSRIAYDKVRERCVDCGLSHREIFPIHRSDKNTKVYGTVVEVINRWNRFIDRITVEAL
ncbi:uncharacterized protein I303_101013 [Kwoniella dejecticola CBS 10117]|uniref:Bacteriophage T5 Orf172 DNA-binding domain-containing protein n=1 Tax=Kwoniella dejecticola CBS 10117 TaxID=1296121 RepID=A0A1A6AGK8_9TREE|nr:uncharacterized protein I303_01017 [Kwoniella dejecticola CBS 10117]OBR89192.1 hypothetical protein I303_01017 [Kwoniella dejecticola CBS 10117]